MSVREKVLNVISQILPYQKAEDITDDKKLVDDLGADELDMIELVMALEEDLGIEIPDEDAEKLVTVKDYVSYAESKLPEEPKPEDKKDEENKPAEEPVKPKEEPEVKPEEKPEEQKRSGEVEE